MAEEIKSESQSFLEELGIKEEHQPNNLEKPLTEEPAKEELQEEDGEQKAKNRRERRLLEQNQRLREEAIAAEARAQALTEAHKSHESTEEADFLKRIDRIYGTDTPEKREATEILKQSLKDAYLSAKREAVEEFETRTQERSQSEAKEDAEEERNLNAIMEHLEDSRGADFGNDAIRQGFLTLLEKISPKDKKGNIIEYADSETVWDMFDATRTRTQSRAKELANRNMVRSGQSQPSSLEDDSTWRELKRLGIF